MMSNGFLRAVKMASLGMRYEDAINRVRPPQHVPVKTVKLDTESKQKPKPKPKAKQSKPKAKPKKEAIIAQTSEEFKDEPPPEASEGSTLVPPKEEQPEKEPVVEEEQPPEKVEETAPKGVTHDVVSEAKPKSKQSETATAKQSKPKRLSKKQQKEKKEQIQSEIRQIMDENNKDGKTFDDLKEDLNNELDEGRKKITLFKRHMNKMEE